MCFFAKRYQIHLHGHDFYILAQGTGMFHEGIALNLKGPPRRDTAMMPWDPAAGLGGYLVLAWQADNPGAWLVHCHIGWHQSMGFALQVIEALSEIKKQDFDTCSMDEVCKAWHSYAPTSLYDSTMEDSGI